MHNILSGIPIFIYSLKNSLSKEDNDSNKYIALDGLCDYYQDLRPDSNGYFARQMLALAKALNNKFYLAEAYDWLGTEGKINGNYSAGLEFFFRSLELDEQLKDSSKIANVYNGIGNIYKEQKLYTKAIPRYLNCKSIAEQIHDTIDLVYANMNLGYVYNEKGLTDSALLYEQAAYTLIIKISDQKTLGFILGNLGNIQLKMKNKALALDYYKMAVEADLQRKNTFKYLSMTYMNLARFYSAERDNDSAVHYTKKAIETARHASYLQLVVDATLFLANVYSSENNKDSTIFYQNEYIAANASLNNREKISQFENLDFNGQLQQQEKEESLKKANEDRRHNIQLAVLAIVILSSILLFLLISRSIVVSHKVVEFLGMIVLLVVFEFINLLLHPFLASVTHDSPVLMLLALVAIAVLLVPFHHRLEKWVNYKLVEKNKAIRLANAKKQFRN